MAISSDPSIPNDRHRTMLPLVANELALALSLALACLVILSMLSYEALSWKFSAWHVLVLSLCPNALTVIFFRHYMWWRLQIIVPTEPFDGNKGHTRGRIIVATEATTSKYYLAACLIACFGSALLPLQYLFAGTPPLHPTTGDPYPFYVFTSICWAFTVVLFGILVCTDVAVWLVTSVSRQFKIGMDQTKIQRSTQHGYIRQISRQSSLSALFHKYRVQTTFLASTVITMGGILVAQQDPIVRKVTIPIHHLPKTLDGFRIVQLSDLHVGLSVGRTRMQRTIQLTKETCSSSACDLIAITGDLVDGDPYQLWQALEPLQHLPSPAAKLYIMGNHEHLHHISSDRMATALADFGIDSLINSHVRLPKDNPHNEQLVVIGWDDLTAATPNHHHSTVPETFANAQVQPGRDTTILLAHQPNHLSYAKSYGPPDVMLSGHTHAGQMVPFTLGAWLFNAKFAGYYPSQNGMGAVVVSAGTHWWGPPIRFTTWHHEIVDITLTRQGKN